MHPSELFDEIKKQYGFTSDSEIAALLGLTASRISQLKTRTGNLTARQVNSFIQKAAENAYSEAVGDAIKPVVEMYKIERIESKQDINWELLPTGPTKTRNVAIRKYLEGSKGIYVFFDSLGCAIYVGKTERQNIWKEMTNAFNRTRSNHAAFLVDHPITGQAFSPAYETSRQPRKKQVYLFDTAHYFSAYEVKPGLIPKLEALLVRCFCNTLTNKKMEKF